MPLMAPTVSQGQAGRTIPVSIENEMKRSYLLYSMSVIVGRALPDVRDGLKPIHRRILFAMNELALTPDKPYKKSATIVGEVMGKYHPHGDVPIYETLVRMAQDFSQRYLLVDGHGNFGSVDGDPPAAMRYTEARMAPISLQLLADIDKDTVDFGPNFDESLKEPKVLPARFPNLLANGASGIAVGMATNIPPHNLGEVIDATVMLIDNPDADVDELMTAIKGPDFPTAGIILGRDGIVQAYKTGRGSIVIRARSQIEVGHGGKNRIIVTELPYQVNKAKLIENIAQLVRDKKIDGITDLRDESDREGMRIVIELRRDADPNIVLNQLYAHTAMQTTFGVIMLVLVDGQPRVLNLKEILHYYILHQKDVVTRRTRFDLARAEERAHILQGLRIALDHLDEVIALIRNSRTPDIARKGLMSKFALSEKQAQAILNMTLQRLTGLEREKIENEYNEVMKLIDYLKGLLSDEHKIMGVIKKELLEVKEKFADERRTEIAGQVDEINIEDLVPKEHIVVTLTHDGYIKRIPLATYKSQKRGGKGIVGAATKNEDFLEELVVTDTHSRILFLTDRGKIYSVKAYDIPEAGRQARGTAAINLISIAPDEKVRAVIPVRDFDQKGYLLMVTKNGMVKKTPLGEFRSARKTGIAAMTLAPGDDVVQVRLTSGKQEVLFVTANGIALRCPEEDIRPMGRIARGVHGIRLEEGDRLVAMDILDSGSPEPDLLVVSRYGFGKRTPLSEYRIQSRGGKGIKTFRVTDRSGDLIGAKVVSANDELILLSREGSVIRIQVSGVPVHGRVTQGVKLMTMSQNDEVVALAKISEKQEPEER